MTLFLSIFVYNVLNIISFTFANKLSRQIASSNVSAMRSYVACNFKYFDNDVDLMLLLSYLCRISRLLSRVFKSNFISYLCQN